MEEFWKNMSKEKIIVGILALLILFFVVQNFTGVEVKLLFFSFKLPLVILIAVVFLTGYMTAEQIRKKNE
jgi:uncharacterized integral membrane protein